MKRILYLILTAVIAFAMCAAFAGCGSGSDEEHAEPTSIYEAIGGQYMDKVSERASAVLSADLESDCVTVDVFWAGSATETTEWTMHATINEDNQLVYNDCVKKLIVTDEDGNTVSEDTQYTDGEGYFEYADNGELKWTGAQDEDCRECIFVPVEE
ncbi:MAG: hypothetical protein MJ161_04340 [Clostridia bacterium]|nr:hypothetical protein [Clostridia bacterium]